MRLFVAIQVPSAIRSAIAAFIQEFRAIAPQTKWVRAETIHITLKFIGGTDPGNLHRIETALAGIRSDQPVTMEFRGMGFFPNEKRPRVFWIGTQSSLNLKALAADIDQSLHQLGFPMEDRPFTPHLTLARFDTAVLPPKLAAVAKENAARSFGSLTSREFHLIESKLKSTGAEYTTLQSFPFVSGSS
ncbi:MAG TPA: RNA 2',3'-cyclic phosphodiesterase [Candidatus Acidoferrum sp.]|jgi:2'-5' RNA ligase